VGQLQCAGNHLELNWQACRNGTICINGTCQTGTCTDTDPNNDLEVRGTVSITDANGESWYSDNDSCSDDQTVVEYSCDGAYFTDRSYNCEAGKICNAGACQTSQASCTDTDPTNNENVKGTASGTFSNGSLFSWDDFCSANGERLVQANCVNNRPFDIVQQCTYGCKDGACQPPPCLCTDSDPQNDPRVAGEAVDIDGVGHHDYCNGKQLIQFACTEKGMAASKNTFCIGGCLNGACR